MESSTVHADYSLVQLANGAHTVYSSAYEEKIHPGLGPQAEAELLYVRQLRIAERLHDGVGEFVIWDVGLGVAANAVAALCAGREIQRPLRLVSFDNSTAPVRFALDNAAALKYLEGYTTVLHQLLQERQIQFSNGNQPVDWNFCLGDFPEWLAGLKNEPAPHIIMFDAFSPAKNPAMWTLPVFTNLFGVLDPARPCSLTTYSRSTLLRVTLLLAGFFVGVGRSAGLKEETTVAANTLDLIEQPLDRRWLDRARRSVSAEPLREPVYRQAPLSMESWEILRAHSQFQA